MSRRLPPTRLAPEPVPAPAHLSPRSAALWAEVVPSRLADAPRLALLTVGLESLDRAEAARAEVETKGMTAVTGKTGVAHVNPAVRVERESRALFAKVWAQLGLDKPRRPWGVS